MANVFKATQVHGGSFRATDMVMQINGAGMAGHIVQQITMQYQQQITTLFEIGSNNVYYVGGRAQGSLSLARVAGPESIPNIVIDSFNDICNPGQLKLTSGRDMCKKGSAFTGGSVVATYVLGGVLITSLGISTQAQDVVVNEQMAFQFIDLAVNGVGDKDVAPPGFVNNVVAGGVAGGISGAVSSGIGSIISNIAARF